MPRRLHRFLRRLAAISRPLIVIGVLSADGGVVTLAVWHLGSAYGEAKTQAALSAKTLARAAAATAGGLLRESDMALRGIDEEVTRRQATAPLAPHALDDILTRQRQALHGRINLRMTDAAGIVTQGHPPSSGITDLSDRDFFLRAAAATQPQLVIGRPVLARIARQWVLPLARRINDPAGSFAGIVYANIPIEHLHRDFSALPLGEHGEVILFDHDGLLILRHPETGMPGNSIGLRLTPGDPPWDTDAVPVLTDRTLDGMRKMVSILGIEDYPLMVGVALAEADYLRPWSGQVGREAGAVLTGILLSLILLDLLRRGWRRQDRLQSRLQAARAESRALRHCEREARVATDLVLLTTPVGMLPYDSAASEAPPRIRRANDAAARLLARDQDELSRLSLSQVLPLSPQPCQETVVAACDGTHFPAEIIHCHKNGLGLATIRDLSHERSLEAALNHAQAELESVPNVLSNYFQEPLARLQTSLDALSDRDEPLSPGEARQAMEENVHRLRDLGQVVESLRQYSRIGLTLDAYQARVSLEQAITDALGNLRQTVIDKGASVGGGPGLADPDRQSDRTGADVPHSYRQQPEIRQEGPPTPGGPWLRTSQCRMGLHRRR